MLEGNFGYSFEYDLPVTEVVGDRLLLSFIVSFTTILFTWMMSFPIGIYSATHQYSWGDHGLTFVEGRGVPSRTTGGHPGGSRSAHRERRSFVLPLYLNRCSQGTTKITEKSEATREPLGRDSARRPTALRDR